MTEPAKNPRSMVSISFNKIIDHAIVYVNNLRDFLYILDTSRAECLFPEWFPRMQIELELYQKQLNEYQKRRAVQIKNDIGLPVSEPIASLLKAVSGHGWFQKSYWGKSTGLKTVSRDEAINLAMEAVMSGIVFFDHLPVTCPKRFRIWSNNFWKFLCLGLRKFIESA